MHLEEDKEPKGKNPRDSNQRNISILVKKLVPPMNLPISRNFPLEMTFPSDLGPLFGPWHWIAVAAGKSTVPIVNNNIIDDASS